MWIFGLNLREMCFCMDHMFPGWWKHEHFDFVQTHLPKNRCFYLFISEERHSIWKEPTKTGVQTSLCVCERIINAYSDVSKVYITVNTLCVTKQRACEERHPGVILSASAFYFNPRPQHTSAFIRFSPCGHLHGSTSIRSSHFIALKRTTLSL